jgi:hypothetical protein
MAEPKTLPEVHDWESLLDDLDDLDFIQDLDMNLDLDDVAVKRRPLPDTTDIHHELQRYEGD